MAFPKRQQTANNTVAISPAIVASSSVPVSPAGVVPISSAASTAGVVPISSVPPQVVLNTGTMSLAQPSTNANNSSTSRSPATVAHPPKAGLSGGAVAGIAICMLLAGALIAGAIFFFLLRRQKKIQYATAARQPHQPTHDWRLASEKHPTVVASPVASNIENLVPQPVSDDTITGDVSKIRDSIKNHVRTYYHTAPIPTVSINVAGLQHLARATGVESSALAVALANPTIRQDTLRLVISWFILSKCTGERHPSLLPKELAKLTTSISGIDGSDPTQSALFSKWKAITGALLQQRLLEKTHDPSRAESFVVTIVELDSVLAPFVQGSVDGGQRRKNLDMILTRSANLAFLFFSQPGSFCFDFLSGNSGLVAFPALAQMIGDQGQVLKPSRLLIDKEVAV